MNETFGAVLRRLRHVRGLTQERLAETAGVSAQAVRLLEAGRRRFPRPSTVTALADALRCTDSQRELLLSASQRASDLTRGLPSATVGFTGRAGEVEELTQFLAAGVTAPAVPIAAITGMGGIGKTSLALKVAEELADQFPDGQFLLDLRGFSRSGALDPLTALELLLGMVGTADAELPDDVDRASARFRSAVAGRRMLLILDNAADSTQVLPLLPGTSGTAVVVTSRRLMPELGGARQLQLDSLSEQEAVDLLAEIGGPTVRAESGAAVRIVQYCARLPLAVRVAGAQLIGRPASAAGALADRLADLSDRLSTLDDHGRGVRSSIAVSVEQLADSDDPTDVAAGGLLPRLAVLDGADVSTRVASRVAGVSTGQAERLLERLSDVSLTEALTPTRYRLHDLVAGYFDEVVPAAERRTVRCAALETYSAMTWQLGGMSRRPAGPREELADEGWRVGAADLEDRDTLLDLLDDERANLVATVRQAVEASPAEQELAVRLGIGFKYYGVARKRWAEWRDVTSATAPAAGDALPKAMLFADHGLARAELNDFDLAADALIRATEVLASIEAPEFEATTLVNLSHVLERAGRIDEGLVYGTRSLDRAIATGSREEEAESLLVLGMLHGKLGSPERSSYFTRAVEVMRANGPPRGLAMVFQQIGLSYRESGDFAAAIKPLEESLRLLVADNAGPYLSEAHEDLGWIRYLSGDAAGALKPLTEALRGAQEFELWDREGSVRLHLAQVLMALGRRDEAREHLDEALQIYGSRGMAAADEAQALLDKL
ncbi:helix-turn-helix domain-containing protein [Kribbella lupini]|uniref:XRE family transcriptional regulator n=1 Tax=Kribbella lupini TaxID=291602 RepID=A0ABN2BYJ9_9ACTN